MPSIQGRIIFCGENPEMKLYRPDTEQLVALASYWRCTFSLHGIGNALVINVESDTPNTPMLQGIYTDNFELGRWLADTFVQHFEDFKGRGWPQIQLTQARFVQEMDSRRYHRVAVYSANDHLILTWDEALAQRLFHVPQLTTGLNGETKHDVYTVICPCKTGSIVVNGQGVEGQVRSDLSDPNWPRCTAFMAFSETWVEK
ncbi:MAG: hypothetical protein F9K46_12895 [Anaerolineae bacterium]|nr:MAG: hypothetical protein F9K46_12895 [Anaerolineae bacterium]